MCWRIRCYRSRRATPFLWVSRNSRPSSSRWRKCQRKCPSSPLWLIVSSWSPLITSCILCRVRRLSFFLALVALARRSMSWKLPSLYVWNCSKVFKRSMRWGTLVRFFVCNSALFMEKKASSALKICSYRTNPPKIVRFVLRICGVAMLQPFISTKRSFSCARRIL